MEKSLHRFSKGDLIVFEGGTKSDGAKSRYEHWAVYVGESEIIHYQAPQGSNGLTAKLNSGVIQETLQEYMGRRGEGMTVRLGELSIEADSKYFPALDPEVVVERARSKVGKKEYNLIKNNCEHFAKWCKYGKEMSDQIQWGAGIASMLVGFVAGALVGIMNGMAFAGLLGAVIGCCIGAVGGGGIGLLMTAILSFFGRRDDLLPFGVLLFSGDIGVMLNLYTSDMFACIWKGFLLSCTVVCVAYVYHRRRPWMKKTVRVALAVLQIGLFVAGYASTSAVGDFFFGVVGMMAGWSCVAMVSVFHNEKLRVFVIWFVAGLVLSISYCTGVVVLTGQVTAVGLCLGGFVGGIPASFLLI